MKKKPVRLKKCPACNGSGTRTCVLGTLTCGRCLGTGKINPRQKQDFVSCVRRQFAQKKKASALVRKLIAANSTPGGRP